MQHPEALGYKDASAIRNIRVAPEAGRIDIMLFPVSGRHRLVLVEAKRYSAADAPSKVIGQLLMYYAGALSLGMNGLDLLCKFAKEYPDEARGTNWISAQRVCGGIGKEEAWERLQSGGKLLQEDIALLIAIDDKPRNSLCQVVSVLRDHKLRIDIVVVKNGDIKKWRCS